MARGRSIALAGAIGAITALFFLWHAPLLTTDGRVRGFTSDAAILALMGKKMLELRGFDIFFWGQNYVGPLTSMFIAAAGAVLGGVDPLALRIGTFVLILFGIFATGFAIWPIDRRAAVAAMFALAVTPSVVLRLMVNPGGGEMAFFLASCLVALYFRSPKPLTLGLLAGFSWWMNQQVVFALFACAAMSAFQHRSAINNVLRLRDRWAFRTTPIPGVVHALAWLSTRAGAVLLLLFVVFDLLRIDVIPFVFGRAIDALLLLLVPLLLVPVAFGEYRQWRLPRVESLAPLARFGAGFSLGYAPVWLGRTFGWYKPAYGIGFPLNYPSDVVGRLIRFGPVATELMGIAPTFAGVLYVLALCAFVVVAVANWRRDPRRLVVALVPLSNFLFYLLAGGRIYPHYFSGSVAMAVSLAAIGGADVWSRSRAIAIAGALAAFVSLGTSSHAMHQRVLHEPDPLPLLRRVERTGCRICYADFWIAYRYRLLDDERRGWIAYLSQNRTLQESAATQRFPGQRCLVTGETVVTIAHDLPLKQKPPR